jgi:hypothetical protein
MRETFNIAVSRELTAKQFAEVIGRLTPAGTRIDVRTDYPSDANADIAATAEKTIDPYWPCALFCRCGKF